MENILFPSTVMEILEEAWMKVVAEPRFDDELLLVLEKLIGLVTWIVFPTVYAPKKLVAIVLVAIFTICWILATVPASCAVVSIPDVFVMTFARGTMFTRNLDCPLCIL